MAPSRSLGNDSQCKRQLLFSKISTMVHGREEPEAGNSPNHVKLRACKLAFRKQQRTNRLRTEFNLSSTESSAGESHQGGNCSRSHGWDKRSVDNSKSALTEHKQPEPIETTRASRSESRGQEPRQEHEGRTHRATFHLRHVSHRALRLLSQLCRAADARWWKDRPAGPPRYASERSACCR